MPKVSVIVPIYNTEAYLERCLLSLLGQTFQNFEILCVDDASQDGSARIAETFSRRDGRLRLIRHDRNLGAGGARNSGIRAAASNYLAFVDSDDHADNDLLAQVYAATRGEFFDVVSFGYRSVDSDGNFVARAVPTRRDIDDAHAATGRLLMTEPHPWNKLWRRQLFDTNDIWFPENMYWEDLATVPRLMLQAKSITFLDRALYSYLDRQDSTVNRISDQHILDYFRSFDIIKDFLIERNQYESQRADFEEIIRISLSWYSEKISASRTLTRKSIVDGVRYCGLLASSYICADDAFRKNDLKDNVDYIKSMTGRVEISRPEPPQIQKEKSVLWPSIFPFAKKSKKLSVANPY